MNRAELATLGLLDPDQGVCPSGHRCALSRELGYRECSECEFIGRAPICWGVTGTAIDAAEHEGADQMVVEWARLTLLDRT